MRARVGLRGIWYVGSHGYSLHCPGSRPLIFLDPKQKAGMAKVRRLLARQFRGVAGIQLEPKEGSVAVHYRNASRRAALRAAAAVRQILQAHPSLHLLSGKKVWELLPDRRTSKWTAIQYILRRESRPGSYLLFYLGDNSTDERVFQPMKGISIAVGKRRRTTARFFLRSPGEVRRLLKKLGAVVK